MMRRLMRGGLGLFTLAGLTLVLRHDIGRYLVEQGSLQLQSGDLAGAERTFRQAAALGSDAAQLAYHLGIGLYRQGRFEQAGEQFAAASASADAGLATAARYNRGNCLFRQAERMSAGDPQAAARLFRAALDDYGKVPAHAPEAMNARHNLGIAQARLAALLHGPAQQRGRPRPGAAAQWQAAAQGPTPKAVAGRAAGAQGPGSAWRPHADASAARATGQAEQAIAGKTRRDLTQQEVERLLNEARGRETLAGALRPGWDRAERLAQPEKDW